MSKDYTVGATTRRWDDRGILFYADGPGGPGYYGATMMPELYVSTHEEAERWLPMMQLAYDAGRASKFREIQEVLGIK